jgi:hypothetical protein
VSSQLGDSMAYRINAQFKDGRTPAGLADVVAAPAPHLGDTISVSWHGEDVPLRVTAVWTPALKSPHQGGDVLIMVEAREI